MGRKGLGRAFDHVLQAADLDPGCSSCGGPRRTSKGLIVTVNMPELATCPTCETYVNAAGRAVTKRAEDGTAFVKHINLVFPGEKPREVR